MEQFTIHGGLLSLSELINDKNLYIRGQALEIFLSLTDCDSFDWFQKVAFSVVDSETTDTRTLMHQALISLVNGSPFLENLLANRVGSYPGGSCRALQILAFWLSWLRALYTKEQKLILSEKVLKELKLWADSGVEKTSGDAGFETTVADQGNSSSATESGQIESQQQQQNWKSTDALEDEVSF